jgi:hypothetical protein
LRDRNSEDKCFTEKQETPPPTYQHPWPEATNNFFAPLRDLHMENAEPGRKGNSTKTPETNETLVKVGHPVLY